jgi:hypothetical protein
MSVRRVARAFAIHNILCPLVFLRDGRDRREQSHGSFSGIRPLGDPWTWAVRRSVLGKTRADRDAGPVWHALVALAGLELRAFDRIAEQVANNRRAAGVVDDNAAVAIGLDVAASTPSVPAVVAAPTETVNLLVSTHIPARTVPARAVRAIITASEGEILDCLERLPQSP